MPPADQLRAQKSALKFLERADDAVRPGGHHDVLQRARRCWRISPPTAIGCVEIIKGFHIGESSDQAGEAETGADDRTRARTPARPSPRTKPSSTSSTRTASWPRWNRRCKMLSVAAGEESAGVLLERRGKDRHREPVAVARPPSTRRCAATCPSIRSTRAGWWPRRRGATRRRVRARGIGHVLGQFAAPGAGALQRPAGDAVHAGGRHRRQGAARHNDLSLGIVQAQKDISSYYILGYYSTNPAAGRALPPHQGAARLAACRPSSTTAPATSRPSSSRNFNSTDKERQLEEALMLGDPFTDLPAGAGGELLPAGARPLLRAGGGEDPRHRRSNWPARAARRAPRSTSSARCGTRKGVLAATVRDGIKVKLQGRHRRPTGQAQLLHTTPASR